MDLYETPMHAEKQIHPSIRNKHSKPRNKNKSKPSSAKFASADIRFEKKILPKCSNGNH